MQWWHEGGGFQNKAAAYTEAEYWGKWTENHKEFNTNKAQGTGRGIIGCQLKRGRQIVESPECQAVDLILFCHQYENIKAL